MTTLHDSSPSNVQATLNQWFITEAAKITKPSWLPSYTVTNTIPEDGIATPSFSVIHLPAAQRSIYQGNQAEEGVTARQALAILDISIWVSRSNINWLAQKHTMESMIALVVGLQASGAVRVQDYLSDPASPVNVAYRITLGDLATVPTSPDPNPDIERSRNLIDYSWTIRSA